MNAPLRVFSVTLVFSLAACSSKPTPVKSAAMKGAVIGGAIGVAAAPISMSPAKSLASNIAVGAQGVAIGAAMGATAGAVVGLVQANADARDQSQIAAERASQAAIAQRNREEKARTEAVEREIAISNGFHITDAELRSAADKQASLAAEAAALQQQLDEAAGRARTLQASTSGAERLTAQIDELKQLRSRLGGDAAKPAEPDAGK